MTKVILFAAFLIGTLDIASAFIDYSLSTGKNPLFVLNYIASGVFGKAAFDDSGSMKLMGLLFHYIICFCIALVFFLICKRFPAFLKHPFGTAVLVAVLAWIVTNPILFPFTNLPRKTIDWSAWPKILKAIGILFITIGLPLVLIGRYSLLQEEKPRSNDLPLANRADHPL